MDVVIGCRVSPKQKGDIVALMRLRHPTKITLAIGDGANDCNMISKAHVGIGIAGREGMQAARTADFAIGKFKFLKDLMMVHGREAYRRNGELILFMFYMWHENFFGENLPLVLLLLASFKLFYCPYSHFR